MISVLVGSEKQRQLVVGCPFGFTPLLIDWIPNGRIVSVIKPVLLTEASVYCKNFETGLLIKAPGTPPWRSKRGLRYQTSLGEKLPKVSVEESEFKQKPKKKQLIGTSQEIV